MAIDMAGTNPEAIPVSVPMRRCIVTAAEKPRAELFRFVLSPDGVVTPDVAARLPGRGAWLTPERGVVAEAVKRNAFNRAFSGQVKLPGDLAGLMERLLVQRMVDVLGLARRAGQAVSGNDKVDEWVAAGRAAMALLARDAGTDARRRWSRPNGLLKGLPVIEILTAGEIGRAFARDRAVHAALSAGELQRRLLGDSIRLAGLRPAESLADAPAGASDEQELKQA